MTCWLDKLGYGVFLSTKMIVDRMNSSLELSNVHLSYDDLSVAKIGVWRLSCEEHDHRLYDYFVTTIDYSSLLIQLVHRRN